MSDLVKTTGVIIQEAEKEATALLGRDSFSYHYWCPSCLTYFNRDSSGVYRGDLCPTCNEGRIVHPHDHKILTIFDIMVIKNLTNSINQIESVVNDLRKYIENLER